MVHYIDTTTAEKKWGIKKEQIARLCSSKIIKNAKKINGRWCILSNEKKPTLTLNKKRKTKFKFIDLFAGIGGFHQAMRSLGGECIMASEIDKACIETYQKNFGIDDMRGDIKEVDEKSIDKFDVLCAGFPCQPFSKAGYQKGFQDKNRGDLFFNIIRILKKHKEVKFIVLENVRNLADKTDNWEIIKRELVKQDFIITESPIILSPSNFGIPQIRERVYILGIKKNVRDKNKLKNNYIHLGDLGLDGIPFKNKCDSNAAFTVLEKEVSNDYIVNEEVETMIKAWEEFRKNTKIGSIGFPVWINSFGYRITSESEFKRNLNYNSLPTWKKKYVDCNRNLYINNKQFIDRWIKQYDMLNRIKLFQKFEWNCGTDVKSIYNAVIQIRQSGIRVKRPNFYPALVAMVNTPIIFDKLKKHFRYITPREAANLQNFNPKYKFVGSDKQIYRQLGNSVNVKVLSILSKSLFKLAKDGWER